VNNAHVEEVLEEVVELAAAGVPAGDIAIRIGYDVRTVYRYLDRARTRGLL